MTRIIHVLTVLALAAVTPVAAQTVIAVPESGTADAGIASRPVTNVTTNDSINGGVVTLGTTGNATLTQVGSWPVGIVLTPTTGQISTKTNLAAGTYNVTYSLCDKNAPPNCSTATDTIRVINASVVANPDSGTADANVASRPIVNVAVNDSVNGAPATLGASGNAVVAQVGSWPAGISLTPSTGAIGTKVTVPAGVYTVVYSLCDHNSPAKCTTANDTVTVVNPSIKAHPESGSTTAGIASTPIASVVSNDTIDGAPAVLGPSGNATISQLGSWPTGISLNTASGAISTSAAVPPGVYSIPYYVCDRNLPAVCAYTTDQITVATAELIVAVPENGSAITGVPLVIIANVASNDSINGVAATLGTSGNATVAQVGTWPAGLALNSTTGGLGTNGVEPPGSYALQYQICDKNAPATCATTTDVVTVSAQYPEVQVSAVSLNDIEFDWGRDGIYCPTCNFGQGNARFNWTDVAGNVWIGHLDPNTGAFTPPSANNELADNSAFFYAIFGNGPEWAFSTQNGEVVSQLVYTRYPPGLPAVASNAAVALASQTAAGWTAGFLPGAFGPINNNKIDTIDPVASQCTSDPIATAIFSDLSSPADVLFEPVTTADGTLPVITPFGSYATNISGGKPSIRFIPCTRQMVFIGVAPPDASGNSYQQVFWYDSDSQMVQQLTFDATGKTEAFMFQAPEFNHAYTLVTVSNNLQIQIYEQTGAGANGAPTVQLVNQIPSIDPSEPYISGIEPFIHCTPNCATYVVMKLQSTLATQVNNGYVPNGIAVANIDPANPMFKLLVPKGPTPSIQRMDLEYYITAKGPLLYYDRNIIAIGSQPMQPQGRFYVDMRLNPPSGACVGSSAEGGMLPGC